MFKKTEQKSRKEVDTQDLRSPLKDRAVWTDLWDRVRDASLLCLGFGCFNEQHRRKTLERWKKLISIFPSHTTASPVLENLLRVMDLCSLPCSWSEDEVLPWGLCSCSQGWRNGKRCISNKKNILMVIIICSKTTTKKFKQVFLAVMHLYNGFLIYLPYLLLTFSSSRNQ